MGLCHLGVIITQSNNQIMNDFTPITQAQYNAMGSGRPSRLYFIVG